MRKIVIEVAQRKPGQLAVRAVWSNPEGSAFAITLPSVRVGCPEYVALGEAELWELKNAVEQEIRGWAAKLPLDY